jgi:hypothetical protein
VTRNRASWALWTATLLPVVGFLLWAAGRPCGPDGPFTLCAIAVASLATAGAVIRWAKSVTAAVYLAAVFAPAGYVAMGVVAFIVIARAGCLS